MKDNSRELVGYLHELYFVKASNEMNVDSTQLIDLVRAVKTFFNYISVENVCSDVSILYIDDTCLFSSLPDSALYFESLDEMHEHLKEKKEDYLVTFDRGGTVKVIHGKAIEHIDSFKDIVGYSFKKSNKKVSEEMFFNQSIISLHPHPSQSTLFPVWDFENLISKLRQYKIESAAYSSCKILEKCWHDDKKFLFVQKPEHYMRDSVLQFLRNTIGSRASIKPEQNTNDSKPVDLNIEFHGTNRVALIEIKWLGASVSPNGSGVGTVYSESRANDGSKQLCDYIDKEKISTPRKDILGVLVVFDGRRKGTNATTPSLSHSDAHHYKDKEISYNPAYHAYRNDFALPMRFFMHPKMSIS